jgi:hypothetical protein
MRRPSLIKFGCCASEEGEKQKYRQYFVTASYYTGSTMISIFADSLVTQMISFTLRRPLAGMSQT